MQIVQADAAARDAFASKRERQAVDFHRTDQMNIHVLADTTQLDTLVADQTRANAAELVSLPKMTTTASVEAHFLIGGRYPVPTIDDPSAAPLTDSGGTAKAALASPKSEFGIRLSMRPIQLPNGLLRVRVKPRVQTVDFGNSTTRTGKFVPAIVTRQINRSIDLKPGQSFAITGILNDEIVQQLKRVPDLEKQAPDAKHPQRPHPPPRQQPDRPSDAPNRHAPSCGLIRSPSASPRAHVAPQHWARPATTG